MNSQVRKIAGKLKARTVAELPDVGGGAFGAARLAALRAKLQPQQGVRVGRPTVGEWSIRRKIPMSPQTYSRLQELAQNASDENRKISPMQLAGELLEQCLSK